MGGKRPDQYQISPGEAGSTDYKLRSRSEEGLNATAEADQTRSRLKGRQMIPPAVPNPEVERLRAKEMERQEHSHGEPARDEDFVVEVELEPDSDRSASDENV